MEAAERLRRFGPNRIEKIRGRSQFGNPAELGRHAGGGNHRTQGLGKELSPLQREISHLTKVVTAG